MTIIIVFALSFGIVILFLTYKVVKAMRRKTETGEEGLVGEIGTAKTEISATSGKVFIHGEWWNATSEMKIPPNTKVKIVSMKNFTIKVEPIRNNEKK